MNDDHHHHPWMRRVSPLARWGWVCTAVLIVSAGLSPWSGWRNLGLSPWAFFSAPVPEYITAFDLVINVLAFMPLGALGVLALHPRVRGPAAVVLSAAAGTVLSGFIEGAQTYLPPRVPSNIDLLTNGVGTVLGAVAIVPWSGALLDRGRLVYLRALWFTRDATVPLLVLGLWPLTQVYPQAILFGLGEAREGWAMMAQWMGFAWPPWAFGVYDAGVFEWARVLVTSAGILAVGAAALSMTHAAAPRWALLAVLLGCGVLVRTVAWGVQFGANQAWSWVTPGTLGGMAVGGGALVVVAIWGWPRIWTLLALLSLGVMLVAVNAAPANPFFMDWIRLWRPGRLRDVAAVAQWVSTAWPYVMFLVLLVRAVRGQHR